MFSGDLAKNRRIGQLVPYLESSLDWYVVKLEVDKFDPNEHSGEMALNLVINVTMHERNSRSVQSINAKAMASRTQPKRLKLEGNKILAEP